MADEDGPLYVMSTDGGDMWRIEEMQVTGGELLSESGRSAATVVVRGKLKLLGPMEGQVAGSIAMSPNDARGLAVALMDIVGRIPS